MIRNQTIINSPCICFIYKTVYMISTNYDFRYVTQLINMRLQRDCQILITVIPKPLNRHLTIEMTLVLSVCCYFVWQMLYEWPSTKIGTGGRFKNAYELLNLRALKISMLYKNHIFQCMSMIFCVEFQGLPLKFHTKYHTHTLKDVDFIRRWQFKSS